MGESCGKCWDCLDDPSKGLSNPVNAQMILCPTCGNKRCPRATSHRLECSGSNAPGQPGSRYGGRAPRHVHLRIEEVVDPATGERRLSACDPRITTAAPPSPDPAALWALVRDLRERARTAGQRPPGPGVSDYMAGYVQGGVSAELATAGRLAALLPPEPP